jgi:hypothetical protein
MRFTPLHLRAGLLGLNLAAAAGVPAYAVLSFLELGDGAAPLELADPGDLVFRDGEAVAVGGAGVISTTGFFPSRATPPSDEPPADIATPDSPSDTARLEAGPLAAAPHDLEYVFSIVRPDDPLGNFGVLRKRTPAAGGSGPGAAIQRPARSPARPARVTAGGRMAAGGRDTISFFVRDRRYTDADRGLDFMIHAADEAELIYWIPGEPGRMYALPRTGGAGRRPPLLDGKPGGDGLELERILYHDREDVDRGIEEEYREMLRGAPAGALLSPRRRS